MRLLYILDDLQQRFTVERFTQLQARTLIRSLLLLGFFSGA